MPVVRARQFVQLIRPVAAAMSKGPLMGAGLLAVLYVWMESPGTYVDSRITYLRLAAVGICLGAAYVFDDPTEDTIGYVPAPLLFRRVVRMAIAVPVAGAWWLVALTVAGDVPRKLGGPTPAGDLTLEASVMLVAALTAASIGTRRVTDRLGGVVAAPILIGLVIAAFFIPAEYAIVVDSPWNRRWAAAHEAWRVVGICAAAAFVWWNLDSGRYGMRMRLARAGVRPASVEAPARKV